MSITYSRLIQIDDYYERFEYAKLNGYVGESTFGFSRFLNQLLYRSPVWKEVRDYVITRDNGYDLAHPDYPINGKIIVHHLVPITKDDIKDEIPDWVFDPNYLVCVSHITHEAIHYGDRRLLPKMPIERRPNDTCPWKN